MILFMQNFGVFIVNARYDLKFVLVDFLVKDSYLIRFSIKSLKRD